MTHRTMRLGAHDEDRHERAKRIAWLDFDAIERARVLVIGAGAIGNETAKNLVLAGYRRISIVDMDHIVRSNLNRCVLFTDMDAGQRRLKAEVVVERLRSMESGIDARAHTARIQDMGEGFIEEHDMVLGCLDNLEARLHVNARCCAARMPYIDAATDGFVGRIFVVHPLHGACLECGTNRTHAKIVQQRFSCTGADVSFFNPKLAAEITTTAIVAAVQVREALKFTCGKEEAVISNLFYYDGLRNVSEVLEVPVNPLCPHHLLTSREKSAAL
ncbi:MAG: ThiF family adenylyltransferase [Candidatus Thermoplasmatota archaeon]